MSAWVEAVLQVSLSVNVNLRIFGKSEWKSTGGCLPTEATSVDGGVELSGAPLITALHMTTCCIHIGWAVVVVVVACGYCRKAADYYQ